MRKLWLAVAACLRLSKRHDEVLDAMEQTLAYLKEANVAKKETVALQARIIEALREKSDYLAGLCEEAGIDWRRCARCRAGKCGGHEATASN